MPNTSSSVAWAETNVMTRMATRVVGEDRYLGRDEVTLGTRVADHVHELFTMVPPGEALELHFERRSPTFIALHDIGAVSSPAVVAELAAALRQPLQSLTIRQQGSGATLAVLRFIELPSSRGVPVRVWATACEADAATRRAIAEALLAYSRLGVLLVNALSDHLLVAQFGTLRDRLLDRPWPNRDLLLVPRAEQAHLAAHAQALVEGTLVGTACADPTAQTAGIWRAIQGVWVRLRAGTSAEPPRTEPTPAAAALTLRNVGGTAAAVAPAPVRLDVAAYARACATQTGVLDCIVFDRVARQVLATAGRSGGAASRCDAFAALLDAARALGQYADPTQSALEVVTTLDRHVAFVRPLAAHAPLAVAVMVDRAHANLALLRAQVQRLDAQLVQ